MAWFVLIISGLLEAVWATALGRSDGFTKVIPSVIFLVAIVASMIGLAYATKTLPIGTAYAVWVGIGATVTVVIAMLTGVENLSVSKVFFLVLIVTGIIGLKLSHT